MNEWTMHQYYDDGRTEYEAYIGGYSVRIVQLIHKDSPRKDHWSYTVHNRNTHHMFSGNKFPWSAKQAMDFVVLSLSLRALSCVLTGTDRRLWNEDDLDRV